METGAEEEPNNDVNTELTLERETQDAKESFAEKGQVSDATDKTETKDAQYRVTETDQIEQTKDSVPSDKQGPAGVEQDKSTHLTDKKVCIKDNGKTCGDSSDIDEQSKLGTKHMHKGCGQTSASKSRGDIPENIREQIWATLYGQCMGDAIGLLSENMLEKDAIRFYGGIRKLQYKHKAEDLHRSRWQTGDWTDDSDQMILIMQSIVERVGEVDPVHYAGKLLSWKEHGFEELGDSKGFGIGYNTFCVLQQPEFLTDPIKVAEAFWRERNKMYASNGGVMRTSILGIHDWWDEEAVERNAVSICKVTHSDPRCQASVVAVSLAISLMLQGKFYDGKRYDVPGIIDAVLEKASSYIDPESVQHKEELEMYMKCRDIKDLHLGDSSKAIGYTFKCMGAGFWALKQDKFRPALEKIVLCGGDADTNAAVAGALLGCKLRKRSELPKSWAEFKHKKWLDRQINSYLQVLQRRYNARR